MKNKTLIHLAAALSLLPAALSLQATVSMAPGLLRFTSAGHILGFDAEGMYAAAGDHALHVNFVGANTVPPQAEDSPGGEDGPAAPLDRVVYPDLWDGVALAVEAEPGSIYTTTYTLRPGADPAQIRLRYNAPLALTEGGTLSIDFETGAMTESAPVAWQDIGGALIPVEVSFRMAGNEVGFALGSYDPRYPLTIDPALYWNTFLGGNSSDDCRGITVDASGNVYVTGSSYATWGTPMRAFSGANKDAFAAKLASNGTLTWNTFLGSYAYDEGRSIAVDGGGNVYVAGFSYDTWGTPARAHSGDEDAFAAKLSSAGALTWNTFLGGTLFDEGYGIAVDVSGNVYVAGASLATWGSPIRGFSTGCLDGFAAKLASNGTLTWNTFQGSGFADESYGIAVDGGGNVFVAGTSGDSWGSSPVRAYTGGTDAFAAKLTSAGGLTWNSFLGGSGDDWGRGIAVSGGGYIYVLGGSMGTWGPAPKREYTGDVDTFVARLESSGALSYNTFLGGSGQDNGDGIAIDGSERVYVVGSSPSSWGSPVIPFHDGLEAFAVKLDQFGVLVWNAFLGSDSPDVGYGAAVDGDGNVYVAGTSTDTWGLPVRAFTPGSDGFVARVNYAAPGTFGKSAPADGSYASTDPDLSWESADGAVSYSYCYDTTDNNVCDGSWESTGASITVSLSGLDNNTTYYWQVFATNSDGSTYAEGIAGWWSFRTPSFADVPIDYYFWAQIEAFYAAGITTGCGYAPLIYCPEAQVTRAEMAVFIERALHYPALPYTPPPASHYFSDMPVAGKEWMEDWVDEFYRDGITTGCGFSPLIFCPEAPVTRAEMAVFIERALHGTGYAPPPASHYFTDMPVAGKEWMEDWVDQFYRDGITTGCGYAPLIYCPEDHVTRAEMAVFIVRAFGFPLP
jgi:hypothetical protein